MKILQINSFGSGSTGRIVVDLYKALEKNGHECIIGYGRDQIERDVKSIKIGTSIDKYIHGAKTRIFDAHGFSSTKATKEFIKKVEEYNPDIFHLHNIHGYYINIKLLFRYLKDSKKPVIWTLHDCWAFTGHCAYFDFIGCNKWKSKCGNCIQKHSYPSSKLIDSSRRNYLKKKDLFTSLDNMTIITPSKWLANLVKESFFSKYNIQIINNGIDLNIFKPTKSNFRDKYNLKDKFVILGVANVWDKRKGFETFIKLAKRLDNNSIIILVGLDNKQIKMLPQNIIGIRQTKNIEELVEIYTAVDVYVNLSVEETMGLTTVEALACGTPVIVNNATAMPEIVDKDCGIVVKKMI